MQVDLINPFIDATLNVLETMAGTSPQAERPTVKADMRTWGDVTGIIGMAGADVTGSMILSFDKASILAIVSRMLGEEYFEINSQVIDAVGELANMVSGGAKATLESKNFKFDMATPLMITGRGLEITQFTKVPVIVVPFRTGEGQFVVEANLSRRQKV